MLVYLFIYIYIYIYIPNPSARALYDRRSIFMPRLKRLHSEFFFSETGHHINVKMASLPHYLPISGRRQLHAYFSQEYERC